MTDQNTSGRIEVVHGSMFAGKTEHMISRLRQEARRGRRVRAFKHSMDDRYDPDHLVTHRQDRFDAIRVPHAEDLPALSVGYEVIAVDEGHFFKKPLIPVAIQLRDQGKIIIIAGITYDIWGRPFDPLPQLCEIADEIVVKQAPCRVCGNPAPYNLRLTPTDVLHMVGGLDDYEPRCKEHFTPFSTTPPETA